MKMDVLVNTINKTIIFISYLLIRKSCWNIFPFSLNLSRLIWTSHRPTHKNCLIGESPKQCNVELLFQNQTAYFRQIVLVKLCLLVMSSNIAHHLHQFIFINSHSFHILMILCMSVLMLAWRHRRALLTSMDGRIFYSTGLISPAVDGNWTDWGDWNLCSVTCAGGTQGRSRTCTNPPPRNGGRECSGESEDVQSCNENPCPSKEIYFLFCAV